MPVMNIVVLLIVYLLPGCFAGVIAGLPGIGGATLTVPWLVWHNVGMRQAVATSAACGFSIALVGALGFVLVGWHQPALPPGAIGDVYWPAAAMISLASVLAAPFGAGLAVKRKLLFTRSGTTPSGSKGSAGGSPGQKRTSARPAGPGTGLRMPARIPPRRRCPCPATAGKPAVETR